MAWDKGVREDGSDSMAREVAPREHWPGMRALILVVSAEKKGVSSTSGMQATVATSALFRTRAEEVVPRRMEEMERAVRERDFAAFARGAMAESNSFHAVCLDTVPPIRYLNDVSWAAMKAVEGLNAGGKEEIAAYTFDAGPNAVVYYLEENKERVEGAMRFLTGQKEGWGEVKEGGQDVGDGHELLQRVLTDGVSRVIRTRVGDGPVSVQDHLVDEKGEAIQAENS